MAFGQCRRSGSLGVTPQTQTLRAHAQTHTHTTRHTRTLFCRCLWPVPGRAIPHSRARATTTTFHNITIIAFCSPPTVYLSLARTRRARHSRASTVHTRAHTHARPHEHKHTTHTWTHTTTSPQFYRVSLCKSSTSVTFLSASTDGPSVKARIPPSLQRIYRDLSCKRKTSAIPWAHLHRVFL